MKVLHEKCPACLSVKIRQVENYRNFPAILFPIEPHKRQGVPTNDLSIFLCEDCNHFFLNNLDSEFNKRIYEDHYYLYPFKDLESMQEMYRKPFEKVFDIFYKGNRGTLLEIGCDNEQQMKQFINLDIQCTAINPGATKTHNIDFIDGFYEQGRISNSFDYIVSRFNLEHVIDLNHYLKNLNINLNPEGLGFIQVPNIEMFMNSSVLNVFAHEHPHYFCRKSTSALLMRYGFEVLYLSESTSPSLICVFKKPSAVFEPSQLLEYNSSIVESINTFLSKHGNAHILFYGAGLTLTGILYSGKIEQSLLSNIQVVDDNPILHGRFMPNTEMCISPLSESHVSEQSVVLLTLNPAYYEKILTILESVKLAAVYGIGSKGIYRIR